MGLRGFIVFFSFSVLLLQGCVAVQTFPLAARSGDTITLAVGSPDGMTKNNTTVTFTSDSDALNPVDVTANIRTISKVYPDKMSTAWFGDHGNNLWGDLIPAASSHGSWLKVIVLDLPVSLPTGPGYFTVTVTPDVTYPYLSSHVSDIQISMEILPGTGVSHSFSYVPYSFNQNIIINPLSTLEPNKHVLIKPRVQVTSNEFPTYGAVEIKVTAPIVDSIGGATNNQPVLVVFDDQPNNLTSQKQSSWVRVGDEFTINIVSPVGLLEFYEARFAIVLTADNSLYSFAGAPLVNSIKYFDDSGVEVTGPVPSIVLNQ